LNRDVAIKVIPASIAADSDALARFERESHAIAVLSHPNILMIFDVGHSDGHPFAVELLEGESCGRLASGPLPVRKVGRHRRAHRPRAGGGPRQTHRAS
jgi:eukaryotic-like serine/threonine-protein kinase